MSTKKFKPSPGDWKCPNEDCANINFSKRTECNFCGEAKPMEKKKDGKVGSRFSIRSNGLFSPEDWHCKSCGNVNWAKRHICNVCNKPRFEKIENRTGIGGGYCERDEYVEYNDNDDDQVQYDEFGLKKKQFRKKDVEPEIVNDVEREADDSDSEDSKDLGDYDFDDMTDSEVEKDKIEKPEETINEPEKQSLESISNKVTEIKRSRSRSPICTSKESAITASKDVQEKLL